MALQKTPLTPSPANLSSSLPSSVPHPALKQVNGSVSPFWIGLGVSLTWLLVVCVVIAKAGPGRTLAGAPLADWALGISAVISPVAMVWMVTAYLQRASDVETIADPLRRQLSLITGESGAADARIRRFNQAIREQIDLLRNAQTMTQEDLEAVMDRVRQHRSDLERFDTESLTQVKDIQDVIRRSMLQIEQMMDDKFTMLRVLDGKLQQNGDGVARQIETMRDQVARLLEDVESCSSNMAETIDRAHRDGKKLADLSRMQEQSLTTAAEAAAETLGGLSSKIDLSVARFLERASTAREEAERLASALDAQTRALDEFSNTLPTRVGEAESVLRGVADRLYASEKMASEQAAHLGEKLSHQVDGLQSFMDRFSAKIATIDTGLDRRHSELKGLADRIGSTTNEFVSSWEKSLTDLTDRTGNSLLRFTVVNDETRRNAEAVAAHLTETTARYEDAAARMRALSSDSGTHMQGMTEEIAKQLAQFESLSKASNLAGEEVQARATAALQNLQHVLERVLTAREATQGVGEALVKDIYAAVEENEKMIARLNEAAQLGARTIGTAAENLGRQQTELAGKSRASEAVLLESVQRLQQQAESASKGLREQSGNLMGLLAETQSQLAVTDQKLQSFASQAVAPVQKAVQQIDASADEGLRTLSHYGQGLTQQVDQLQAFHSRIGGLNEEMGKATSAAATQFEEINTRIATARLVQEEAARQTLASFADLSDRLHREVAGLDGEAARAVESLQQSAMKIGEQAYQMLQSAQNSGAQLREVTAVLHSEAALAEQKMASLAETIQQRSDAAHTLIDNVASHYEDVSTSAFAKAEHHFTAMGETIRDRAEAAVVALDRSTAHYSAVSHNLEQVTSTAQERVEALKSALEQQTGIIDTGASKLETHATEIAATTGRAVQNLSGLNDKLAVTHESAITYAQKTLAKIEECSTAFERQSKGMAEAAEGAMADVYRASSAFGEQASKVIDGGQQIDGMLRQLTSASSTLADQSAQIRIGMEQQNNRLLAQLTDSVAQMDVTGGKLQQLVSVAMQGADQAAIRFADMTATASQRITVTTQELHTTAERTETSLAALGANITQQAASLAVVGEQIAEQQKIMAVANESQRVQMFDLFEKLGQAHEQASQVAERSIGYLTNSLAEIHRQMGLIGDQSQQAVGNVKMASMGFSDQAGQLLQSAQAAEQQARTVLSVTAALQEQARHLRESLQSESERAGESLGLLLSRLTAGGAEVRELGVDTGVVLSTLQRALGEQTNELSSSMQQITERQRSLMSTLDTQRETINALLNRLTLAQDETAATAERTALRLTDGAQQIIRHVEAMDTKAQSAAVNVAAAAGTFAREAEAIDTHARQAEAQARTLLASTSVIQEQLHDLRTTMQADGEQTGAILNSLLDKTVIGAAEIRDLAAATEMSLTSLSNTAAHQSATLTGTMQQISDRQQSMTISFDAARDVIGGLLNRLTLAQDETASAAERTASRVGESTQQIVRQLDVIGAQANSTLASVQSSVSSFAEQAGVLNLQGQQAEQQMRGVLSVTSGMQEQARHLREAMQVETARVVEQMAAVIAQLDTTNQQLKNESSAAMYSLEQVAHQFATVTNLGSETLRKQTDILSQAADQSEARMANSAEKVQQHLRLVGDVGEKTEAQARQLADTAEFATTRLATLRDSLSNGEKEGREIVVKMSERIAEVKSMLQSELQRLSQMSQEAVAQVTGASSALAEHSNVLRANLAASESALTEAASLVREESSHMPSVLNRGVGEIETATRALKSYAEEADKSLVSTADRFISVTATARSNMIEELQRVGGVAENADKVMRKFHQMLAEQVAQMQQSTAMLSSEQKDLVEKTAVSVTSLAEASERLSVLRGEATGTAERLAREFDMLDQRVSATGTRLAQAGENAAKQVEAMSEAATRAAGQMETVSGSFRDQLERIRAGMQGQIDDINRGLMQITAQLERTGTSLRSTTVGAVSDVEKIGQRFEQASGEAAAKIEARTKHMHEATEEVSRMLSVFAGQFDVMLQRMAEAGTGIKRQEGDMVGQMQSMLSHLGSVAEKLEAARALSGDVSQRAVERLDEVVTEIQAQMNTMTTGAQTAAGIMRGIGQIYSDQASVLSRGVTDAHNQVRDMNKSIDEMQQRTDRMRLGLKAQGGELMKSLREILSQLEGMGGDTPAGTSTGATKIG